MFKIENKNLSMFFINIEVTKWMVLKPKTYCLWGVGPKKGRDGTRNY